MSRSSTSAFLFLSVRMESTEKCDVVIQNFNGKFLKTPPGMTGRCLSPTQMLYTSQPWALLEHELSFSRDLDAYIRVDTLSKQQACCSQMSDYFHSDSICQKSFKALVVETCGSVCVDEKWAGSYHSCLVIGRTAVLSCIACAKSGIVTHIL